MNSRAGTLSDVPLATGGSWRNHISGLAKEAKGRPREMSMGSSSGGSGAKTRPRLGAARQKLQIVVRRA